MNNEPVAWMDSLGNLTKQNLGDFIPLYTHPAELTDEEMYELLEKYQGIELCKAVLRKASEK